MSTIAVIAAHPDDEILGCGATIARHVAEGDKAHVLLLADGESSRGKTKVVQRNIKKRQESAKKATKIIGVSTLVFGKLPDNAMDTVPLINVVRIVEKFINKVKPDIVYTHHYGDLNIDHKIVHEAVITACRPQPGFYVKEIYAFEVLSSTEWSAPSKQNVFCPNYFVNVKKTINKKMEALHIYQDEMREFPHSRSYEAIEALAKYRGASAGMHAAEAFEVVRFLK